MKEVYDDINFSMEENEIRFEQEVAIMWGISSHPNIITLVGYSDNPRCIITKVISFLFSFSFLFLFFDCVIKNKLNKILKLYKMDLSAFIKSHPEAIPSGIIMKIANDIAAGMSMMNSAGIVHRDLKSLTFFSLTSSLFFSFQPIIFFSKNRSNILLEDYRGKLNAVICDFGLARVEDTKVFFHFFFFLLSFHLFLSYFHDHFFIYFF